MFDARLSRQDAIKRIQQNISRVVDFVLDFLCD